MSLVKLLNGVKTHLFSDINYFAKTQQNIIRWASKKTSGNSKNRPRHPRPKRRRILLHDGCYATAGSILVKQLKLRFHPGLNVGFGKNGSLFAMENGKVLISCEKLDPMWDHTWIKRIYGNRTGQTIYKKFFNIIPDKQVGRFKLIDEH